MPVLDREMAGSLAESDAIHQRIFKEKDIRDSAADLRRRMHALEVATKIAIKGGVVHKWDEEGEDGKVSRLAGAPNAQEFMELVRLLDGFLAGE